MPPELRSIFPEANSPATEIFQIYQTTQEFYQEVKYREDFQNYCQWYYEIAEQQIHQARQFPAKAGKTVHSNVTAEPSTQAVSRNALRKIPKAPFQSLGIE
ncbi:MAG: hypothetical protein F6K54_17340 [Okeania sp. SIO3B5]|uniref:hypothetical protein n=1 Tax=Okeania sp. SIO3B5 TaxID=2607811 RepID=UPI0013FE77A9|nr:hypothetical protein [Okeania sp. SIO3B5]NEO54688.1 hypothetical protein [Okeania sp. SIO3B5]